MLNRINDMERTQSQIERSAQQAAQRQAAKVAAKRAYDIAKEIKRDIDESSREALIWESTIGNVMFIYFVVGVTSESGVDLSTACNFVEYEDAKAYAKKISPSYNTTEIYLNKPDGTLKLLDIEL